MLNEYEEDQKPLSNPLRFLETVFDFVSRESDLFKSDSVVNDVMALVRTTKEKAEAEERKRKEKAEGNVKDREARQGGAPNKGNDLNLEKYSWVQSLEGVVIYIPVPPGTKSSFIACDIKTNHLKVGLEGQPPIIDGELFQSVKVDDCFWSLDDHDQKSISILLTKQNQTDEWWKCLVKGDPEIDTQKVEPESSKLSDLDPETQQTIEKMMHEETLADARQVLATPSMDDLIRAVSTAIAPEFQRLHSEVGRLGDRLQQLEQKVDRHMKHMLSDLESIKIAVGGADGNYYDAGGDDDDDDDDA